MCTDSKTAMQCRQLKRQECFQTNQEKLQIMRDVKKGMRYRKWLYNRLHALSMTEFETEEEEYKSIGKFNRGIWISYDTTFKTKVEMEFMTEIARAYGAFDY
tara:strand:+ start:230 stop:535 length:306 start_codon:yes stop_codon:yes gene_type:complete